MKENFKKLGNWLTKQGVACTVAALALSIGGYHFLKPQEAQADNVVAEAPLEGNVVEEAAPAEVDQCADLKAQAEAAEGYAGLQASAKALWCKVFGPENDQQSSTDAGAEATEPQEDQPAEPSSIADQTTAS